MQLSKMCLEWNLFLMSVCVVTQLCNVMKWFFHLVYKYSFTFLSVNKVFMSLQV